MLENITRLKYEINGKSYWFLCDNDSSIADVKESLSQFLSLATQISNRPAAPVKEAEIPQTEEKVDNGAS